MNNTTLPVANGHNITLQQAIEMTKRYRQQIATANNSTLAASPAFAFSETFNRAPFDALLAKPSVAGIRVYYGMDESLKVHAIFVGVNERNEDLITSSAQSSVTEDIIIIETGQRCPDICPPASQLNQ